MASPYKSFLGSGNYGNFNAPEWEEDPDEEFEVSTECDFYAPRSPGMRRRAMGAWDIPSTWDVLSEEEIQEVIVEAAEAERRPLLRIQNTEGRSELTVIVGFILSVIANLFLTISSGSIQALTHPSNYSEFELNVFRFAGSLILAPPILLYRRQMPRLSTRKEIIGTTAVTILTIGFNSCLFASVKFAPLGTVGCLYRTAVMVFCMILSRIIMKEKITVPKVAATIIGTGGVFLVTQPWSEDTSKSRHLWLGYTLSTAAGVIAALKIIAQKRLIPRTDVVTIQFWTSLGGLAISAIFMAVPSQHPHLPTGDHKTIRNDWLLLLAHAFSTGIATLLIYKSQQMISAILFGLSTSFNVIFMLIGQYTVLRYIQPGHQNPQEYSGAVLVVISALLVPFCAIIKKKFFPDRPQATPGGPVEQGPGPSSRSNIQYESITDRPIR